MNRVELGRLIRHLRCLVRACSQQVSGASSPNPAAFAAQCWLWVEAGKEGACSSGSFDHPRLERLRHYRCPVWGPADGGEAMPGGLASWQRPSQGQGLQSVPSQLFTGAQGVALGQRARAGQLGYVTSF